MTCLGFPALEGTRGGDAAVRPSIVDGVFVALPEPPPCAVALALSRRPRLLPAPPPRRAAPRRVQINACGSSGSSIVPATPASRALLDTGAAFRRSRTTAVLIAKLSAGARHALPLRQECARCSALLWIRRPGLVQRNRKRDDPVRRCASGSISMNAASGACPHRRSRSTSLSMTRPHLPRSTRARNFVAGWPRPCAASGRLKRGALAWNWPPPVHQSRPPCRRASGAAAATAPRASSTLGLLRNNCSTSSTFCSRPRRSNTAHSAWPARRRRHPATPHSNTRHAVVDRRRVHSAPMPPATRRPCYSRRVRTNSE